MENKILETRIELSPSLRLYGELFATFRVPGLVVNCVLVVISVSLFFSLTLITLMAIGIFFLIFLYIQLKIINKATRAMKKSCTLVVTDEQIEITTGFPHNFDYKLNAVSRSDITQLLIKGNTLFGYYVEFLQPSIEKEFERIAKIPISQRIRRGIKKPFHARFGLWRDPQDAVEYTKKISTALNLPVIEQYSVEDDS